ncbi:MAG: glycoside hydrolase family 3 N-terminal domain-containing protein [Actinomycetaceae bacterium]|nr:glycoside hydrolase family 3 N-terminal domain-containing protein [Actinomycetaceae bacterium]MDU0971138.1 glycoside hydrolase family 3 N-terminal domain-containing protein [Actinomycetaceae bacterium]
MTTPADLTLSQAASLTSGSDAWHLQGVEGTDIQAHMITDGPHGLRAMIDDGNMDLSHSHPATCFPPAVGLSSTWNEDLTREVGAAIGEEAIDQSVAVILGPGLNIKRHPYGGRNFEYFSEDPLVGGHMAASLAEGIQSQGVAACLKHFATNNQETDRLRVDARIDARALREIYLAGFEYAVKRAKPWTMMCAYNKINGVYAFANHWLLTQVLRDEWGFDGVVVSDWGACHDRIQALQAGLDLEMPPSQTDDRVVAAVEDGRLDRADLDRSAARMLTLHDRVRAAMARDITVDEDAHDALAARVAREVPVLLENDGVLPLSPGARVAVIGEFARTPRYQGAGSSRVASTRVTSLLDALAGKPVDVTFAPGFTLDDSEGDPALVAEAVEQARAADVALVMIGLPGPAEAEGFDRTSLDMPAKQIELLRAVCEANPRTVAVVSNGAVVSLAEIRDLPAALVEGWLGGQASGAGLADVLMGDADFTGRLTETIPVRVTDLPADLNFPGGLGQVVYGESIFVGYRYTDTIDAEVAYPFGFGRSYTTFALAGAQATRGEDGRVRVTVQVTNQSDRDSAQVVQVYVAPPESAVRRPRHELAGFAKVAVPAGHTVTAEVTLDEHAFSYFHVGLDAWKQEGGTYTLEVATSSRDIAATLEVDVPDDGQRMPLGLMSTIGEWLDDPEGGPALREFLATTGAELPADPVLRTMLDQSPLKNAFVFGIDALSLRTIEGFYADWERAHQQ